jgi:Mg2+/Co2+ transporter CorC
MTAVVIAVGLFCLGMFAIHHWAGRRMLVVEKESGPGLLDLAEEARPALVLSQILAAGLAVVAVGAWPQLGMYGRVVVTGLVLVGGLLVPLRFGSPQRGGVPWWVRILSWPLSRHTEVAEPRNGGPIPSVDPLDERLLVDRMLRFRETEISEVMVPRSDVEAVEREAELRTLLNLIEEYRHSRYPVYETELDHIAGYLTVFDLLRLPPGTSGFQSLVRTALMVPETKPCHELLDEMLTNGHEFAIVVDEFGGTAGIVTGEDLVEELIGEIWDEHERASVRIRRVGLELPEGDYETLAGFLLEQFGRIPVRGDTVRWEDTEFEVLTADRRRIESVQVTLRVGGRR